MKSKSPPHKIRVSIGSASVLGLQTIENQIKPTTCYLMTSSKNKCVGKCLFCPQSQTSDTEIVDQLSRIQWPEFSLNLVFRRLNKLYSPEKNPNQAKFERICIQTLNYPGFFDDIYYIISKLHQKLPNIPVSCASPPISKKQMQILDKNGLDTIAFALDACNPKLFAKIKGKAINGPYRWKSHQFCLNQAIEIFGVNHVSTHLIVGLGESEKEMIECITDIIQRGIQPGIFFFTPVKGTKLSSKSRKPILHFRHIQLTRELLLIDQKNYHRFQYDDKGKLIGIQDFTEEELNKIIHTTSAFQTAGCPGCNRPFYTSRPGEEQDGYPRPLTSQEKKRIFQELQHLI
jgi:biotin synthase